MSTTPGTTRDVVELSLNFHGYPILVADTAGLRNTADEIEAIGVQRAQAKSVQPSGQHPHPRKQILKLTTLHRAAEADLKLCVLSLSEVFPFTPTAALPLAAHIAAHIAPLTLAQIDANTVILLNKIDTVEFTPCHHDALRTALYGTKWAGQEREDRGFVEVSVTEGKGLDMLVDRLKVILKEK